MGVITTTTQRAIGAATAHAKPHHKNTPSQTFKGAQCRCIHSKSSCVATGLTSIACASQAAAPQTKQLCCAHHMTQAFRSPISRVKVPATVPCALPCAISMAADGGGCHITQYGDTNTCKWCVCVRFICLAAPGVHSSDAYHTSAKKGQCRAAGPTSHLNHFPFARYLVCGTHNLHLHTHKETTRPIKQLRRIREQVHPPHKT